MTRAVTGNPLTPRDAARGRRGSPGQDRSPATGTRAASAPHARIDAVARAARCRRLRWSGATTPAADAAVRHGLSRSCREARQRATRQSDGAMDADQPRHRVPGPCGGPSRPPTCIDFGRLNGAPRSPHATTATTSTTVMSTCARPAGHRSMCRRVRTQWLNVSSQTSRGAHEGPRTGCRPDVGRTPMIRAGLAPLPSRDGTI